MNEQDRKIASIILQDVRVQDLPFLQRDYLREAIATARTAAREEQREQDAQIEEHDEKSRQHYDSIGRLTGLRIAAAIRGGQTNGN